MLVLRVTQLTHPQTEESPDLPGRGFRLFDRIRLMPTSKLHPAEPYRPSTVAHLLKSAAAHRRLAKMLGPEHEYLPSLIATAELFEDEHALLAKSRPEDENWAAFGAVSALRKMSFNRTP